MEITTAQHTDLVAHCGRCAGRWVTGGDSKAPEARPLTALARRLDRGDFPTQHRPLYTGFDLGPPHDMQFVEHYRVD